METVAVNYHDDSGDKVGALALKAGNKYGDVFNLFSQQGESPRLVNIIGTHKDIVTLLNHNKSSVGELARFALEMIIPMKENMYSCFFFVFFNSLLT